MILLQKDYSTWITNCAGRRVQKVSGLEKFLDTNVALEEGITLKHIMEFLTMIGHDPFCNMEDIEQNCDEYEYISIIPKYNLDIRNNGVHILSKQFNSLNLELSNGDSIFIFDYMLTKQVLDLEVRIEPDLIEYYDAKYYMPSELTLRELFYAILDGILYSNSE